MRTATALSPGLRLVPPCVPAGGGRALLLPPVLPSHMDGVLVLHVSKLSDVQVGQIDSLQGKGPFNSPTLLDGLVHYFRSHPHLDFREGFKDSSSID